MSKRWTDIARHIRTHFVDRLRGGALSAEDQAERFRDKDSKHYSETIAAQWDKEAREFREAMAIVSAMEKAK